MYCNWCGGACERVHEHVQRTVRDLPLFDAITYLEINIYRVWCEHCGGPKRMRIDWLADQQRVTHRLAESVSYLCSQLSIQHVAKFYRLRWHTVKRIEAAMMDMHLAFTLEVGRHCPNARIVYDLFHVIAKYSRKFVDRVRVDQTNALRRDRAARKVVKASKRLLLRSPRNTNRAPVCAYRSSSMRTPR